MSYWAKDNLTKRPFGQIIVYVQLASASMLVKPDYTNIGVWGSSEQKVRLDHRTRRRGLTKPSCDISFPDKKKYVLTGKI